MLFSEKSGPFAAAHPCKAVTVDGAVFRYVLCGREGKKTLALLNGGMNTLEMWMDYVDPLAQDYRVLLFDYPQELRTNQALVKGMHAFFRTLGVQTPILWAPATAAWWPRSMCRNIRERPAGWY